MLGGGDDLVCESISTRKGKHLAASVRNMGFLPEEILTFRHASENIEIQALSDEVAVWR